MISEKVYKRLCIMDKSYKKLSIEQLSKMIERGKKLIEKHGEEHLHGILNLEEQIDAGSFFSYRIAKNYEKES